MKSLLDIDTSLLDALDFDAAVPCEILPLHAREKVDEPARLIVGTTHECVTPGLKIFCCLPCWERMGLTDVSCYTCHRQFDRDREIWIIQMLGGKP